MEPITHMLTGACIGRAGFNRKTAYATFAATLAAEAADLDMFSQMHGAIAGFEQHRGFTHSLAGAPLVALFVLGVVWLVDRFRGKKRRGEVRWALLWLTALVAALSHVFLDSTNSYGVRAFFPFTSHWYSLNVNAIWEPILFFALLLGLTLPAIFGLADREIGVRRPRFRGRGWAIAALVVGATAITLRAVEHQRALNLLRNRPASAPVLRVAAEPYALNPFHWFGIREFKDNFETGSIHTWPASAGPGPQETIYKAAATPAVVAARQSSLGRFFLNWARFPVIRDLGPAGMAQPASAPEGAGDITSSGIRNAPGRLDSVVSFRDLRFAYFALGHFRGGGSSPLFGITIYVSPDGEITEMRVNSQPW